jgi:hypothetical protein
MVIEGPLAPWAAQMVERLAELGYSPYTTKDHLALVARLSPWVPNNRSRSPLTQLAGIRG